MIDKDVARMATPMNRRWRRRLAGATAAVAAVSAGLLVVPAVAGASTALDQVTQGSTGTIPTAGNPVAAASADIAVTASAVDPANGDVAEIAGNQVFLLVNKANESSSDFGLGTGTLVQGDVYLVAGQGAPGWTPTTSNGSKATTTIIGKPQQVTFDSSGNLLIASNDTGEANIIAVPAANGNYYGFTGLQAGFSYFIAGFTPSTAHLPAAPAIKLPSALTVLSLSASSGLVKGGVQDVALSTAAGIYLLNFSTAQTLFGVSEAAGSFTQVGGGGTAAATAGAQTLNALGAGTTAFAIQSPRIYADSSGNLWVGNDGQTQGSWVLPATTGSVTIDGTSTPVTAGKAYKFAGNGTSAKTTPPTSGAKAVTTSISTIVGVTEDLAGNTVFLMGGSVQTVTKINGAYVVANSSGKYYTQTMTAGDVYVIAGSATHALGKFKTPASITGDSNGNLWITDSNAHILYELTGGPTGVAKAPTSTTTTLAATPTSPQKQGTSVKFTATVSPKAAGTVKFSAGATTLGTVPVTTASGTAFITETTLTVGTYTVTATFTPTTPATFAGSSGTLPYKITTATAPGTTTFNTTPTTGKTVSTSGTETITQTIPASGVFKLTVNDHAVVQMTRPKVSGSTESSHGTLTPAQVTTSRNTIPGWTVSGQVGNFSSGTHSFPGSDLGWTPAVVSQTTPASGVHAGPVVAPGTTPGLTAASTWAKATAGAGIGTTKLGAKLTLVIPSTTPPGTYHATLTVSAI